MDIVERQTGFHKADFGMILKELTPSSVVGRLSIHRFPVLIYPFHIWYIFRFIFL